MKGLDPCIFQTGPHRSSHWAGDRVGPSIPGSEQDVSPTLSGTVGGLVGGHSGGTVLFFTLCMFL